MKNEDKIDTFEALLLDPEQVAFPKDLDIHIQDPELLTPLAERFGIPGLGSIEANLRLTENFGQILIKGRMSSALRLSCVVSLEDFDQKIEEPLDSYFIEPEHMVALQDLEDEDAPIPEALTDEGLIDVGEFLCQSLALSIPAMPRKPDLDFLNETFGDFEAVEEKPNPFAVLADLKLKS